MYDFFAQTTTDEDDLVAWEPISDEDFLDFEPSPGTMRHRLRFVDWDPNMPFKKADKALTKFIKSNPDFLDELFAQAAVDGAEIVPVRDVPLDESLIDYPEEFFWAPCNIAAHGNLNGIVWGIGGGAKVLAERGEKIDGDDPNNYDEDGDFTGEYLRHPSTYIFIVLPEGQEDDALNAAKATTLGEPDAVLDDTLALWSFANGTEEIYLFEDAFKAARTISEAL